MLIIKIAHIEVQPGQISCFCRLVEVSGTLDILIRHLYHFIIVDSHLAAGVEAHHLGIHLHRDSHNHQRHQGY